MSPEQLAALVEAVLFLENEPVEPALLRRITGLDRDQLQEAIQELRSRYADEAHGMEIVELGGGYTLVVKQKLWELLKPRYGKRSEGKLSRAASSRRDHACPTATGSEGKGNRSRVRCRSTAGPSSNWELPSRGSVAVCVSPPVWIRRWYRGHCTRTNEAVASVGSTSSTVVRQVTVSVRR